MGAITPDFIYLMEDDTGVESITFVGTAALSGPRHLSVRPRGADVGPAGLCGVPASAACVDYGTVCAVCRVSPAGPTGDTADTTLRHSYTG